MRPPRQRSRPATTTTTTTTQSTTSTSLSPLRIAVALLLLLCFPQPTSAFVLAMSGAVPTNPSRLRLVTNRKCPFAQKAWIALEEYYGGPKGYELLEVGLYGGNGKPGWFMDINPAGQVPVLWLPTGRIITESDSILDHLLTLPGRKDGQANPLVPASPDAYKKWRSLMPPFLKAAKAAIQSRDSPGLSSALYKLDKQIPTPSPYLAGEAFSVADAAILPFLQRLVDDHDALVKEAAPKLYDWFQEAASQQKSFKATVISGYWMWW